MNKVLFIIGQHGDEHLPIKVIKENFSKKIEYLVAHPVAVSKNKRFLETDLNRSFPGGKEGSLEEKIAHNLLFETRGYQIIDIHTATCETPMFIIVTRLTRDHMGLVKKLGIKRVVLMGEHIASGRALIDHVEVGLSVESGREGQNRTEEGLKKMLNHYLGGKRELNPEFYLVFKTLNKGSDKERLVDNIQAFKYVKKGQIISNERSAQENFYPIMPRAATYKGILCLMARKVSINELSNAKIQKEE